MTHVGRKPRATGPEGKELESAAMPLEYRSLTPPPPLTRGERALRGVALTLGIGGLSVGRVEAAVLALALPAFWPFSDYRYMGVWGRLAEMLPCMLGAAAGYSFAPICHVLDPRRGAGHAL